MKNPIIEGIETAIAAHEDQLKKYRAMLALYNSGPDAENHNARRDGQLRRYAKAKAHHISEKQWTGKGPKPGVKRGPYKKRVKTRVDRLGITSPDWKEVIPATIKKSGRALSSRELIDIIAVGKHTSTRKVLHGRCSAMLYWMRKDGSVKEVTEDGVRKYTVE